MRYLKSSFRYVAKDVLFYYTLLSVLLKSVIMIGFITSGNHARIDPLSGFHNIPYIAVYICFILALLSFSFLFKGRLHMWFLVFVNLLVSVLLLADLWYYRGFGTFVNLHLLKQTANLDNLSDSILSMARSSDIVFVFDIAVLFLMVLVNRNPYKKMNRSVLAFAFLFIASVGYITYMHIENDVKGRGGVNNMLFNTYWAPNQTISNLSPLGYHLYDTYAYWKDNRMFSLTSKEKDEIKAWFAGKKEDLPDNSYKEMFKGKNLIVIQVESLESFVLNQKINGQEITPNLNKLLANSLYFSDFYEQVYNGTSSDADLMANTSVYPVRKGSTFFRYPHNTYNSLPKLLQNNGGYSTVAIHPDKGAYWNWMDALKAIGFQRCIDSSSFKIDEWIGLGLSDGSFLRQVERIAVNQKQPFYMFMVTLSSHGPFNLPKGYRELNLDEKLDQTKLGGYFQSVHYTDKHIGIFLSKLKEDGLLDNTVIVIYGDHTGVHKYYQDEVSKIQPAEDWWLDDHHHIPFIIYQSRMKGGEMKVKGGQVDILPTVAYLMGIDEDKYSDTAIGRNLLKTGEDFAVLSDKTYMGDTSDSRAKDNAVKGIDISDLIIRGNYFSFK